MHMHIRPRDTPFCFFLNMQFIFVRKAQFGKFLLQIGRIQPQIQQGAYRHIPANPSKTIKIQCFHRTNSPVASLLICPAKYPAPNPLSIFTTLMPLAQEFSMVSKADNPPKLAP